MGMNFQEKLLEFLHEKGFATVREVVVERGDDWSGAPALFVWLLLDDQVKDKEMNYEFIESLRRIAHRQMREWEPDLFAYVRVREWQEMVAL